MTRKKSNEERQSEEIVRQSNLFCRWWPMGGRAPRVLRRGGAVLQRGVPRRVREDAMTELCPNCESSAHACCCCCSLEST